MAAHEAQRVDPLLKYAELLLKKGMQEEAGAQLEELLRRNPSCAEAHYTLAVVRTTEGRSEEAASHFHEVIRANPGDVKALNGLGVVLQQLRHNEDAAACYREAIRLSPGYLDARINLALLYENHGRLREAERELEQALALQPDTVRLRYNLANVLHLQGRSLDAVAAYRETLRLQPDHLNALQNFLFALHYAPQFSDRQIFEEHLAAAQNPVFRPGHVAPGRSMPQVSGRRIKVGYLSPDFRGHSVASFIEPVLIHHDRSRFEIFCYANLGQPDDTTRRLTGLTEHWRDICQLSDEKAAAMIVADGIDILVDLAGHTSGSRLPLMARKAAPLQATWIGYPDTTGLPEIDVRITDALADPPGVADRLHTERLIRLGRSFCCYLPPDYAPPVAPLPCLCRGYLTFGSFNNLAKVAPEVVALWARVLQTVPGSRLLMKCSPLTDADVRIRITEAFRAAGVAADRLELHPGDASPADHLAHYGRVDIALDTFPYNGTTTTCEALWMGVPVLTLAGTRHASRTGVSLLTNCGLEKLVAQSPEQYLALAQNLARDTEGLARLRAGLRNRMARSPLTDGVGVTREVEGVFRRMLQGV